MKERVILVGAFDRLNFGDLLFPIIFEKMLKHYNFQAKIDYFGVIESNLSTYGGKATRPLKDLFNDDKLPDHSTIVLVGGEMLAATWTTIFRYLLPKYGEITLRFLQKLLGSNTTDEISRQIVGVRNDLPWLLCPSSFSSNVKVVYNSVGGVDILRLSRKHKESLKSALSEARFISVRDSITKHNLDQLDIDNEICISPDSAIVMSRFFPKRLLLSLVHDKTLSIIEELHKGYFCFQSNMYSVKGKEKVIADQLMKIAKEYGMGIVLLPIGIATGHEDQIAAKKLKALIHNNYAAIVADNFGVYDIMALISCCKCFVGTSLHGAITAVSYDIPRVGLTAKVKKLAAFCSTWDDAEMPLCNSVDRLFLSVEKAQSVTQASLAAVRNRLIFEYDLTFQKILSTLSML